VGIPGNKLPVKRMRRKDVVKHVAITKIMANFTALLELRCAEAQIPLNSEGVVLASYSFFFYLKILSYFIGKCYWNSVGTIAEYKDTKTNSYWYTLSKKVMHVFSVLDNFSAQLLI
jgi:hypothetical protein